MKVRVPPLKSQGIKTKLVPWIAANLPDGKGRWIEPFMGTGVVGFNVAYDNAVMSDINPHVVRFYKAIQSREITPKTVADYLLEQHRLLSVAGDKGYDHYRLVRARFNETFQPLDFLFLSRAGFNGMMRFSKAGKWNIPFCQKPDRFRRSYRTKIVNQVRWVQEVIRPNWDFQTSRFDEIIGAAGASDIIYCDPPYHGRYTDYFNKWDDEQEERLFECLRDTKARFILSTWHHNEWRTNLSVEKYWERFHILTKDHFYHSGAKEENRNPIVEALVMNFEPKQILPIEPEPELFDGELVFGPA